jgi:ABC-2 type transport system permease protein
VLFGEGIAFGWRGTVGGSFLALAVMVLATVSFAGLGMLLAGTLPALTTLAAANGLWLVLLLVSGMVVPFTSLPGWLQAIAKALPSGALADGIRHALSGAAVGGEVWLVLAVWAVAAPAVAAACFRWK